MKILVLGGAGFIGRNAVTALLERGHEVVVGSRHPERAGRRLPPVAQGCERRAVHFERLLDPVAWLGTLAGMDVVVNCVGILRPRGAETYRRVHHLAPAALADACGALGVRRLLHVSALGLSEHAQSAFLRSKHAGERALLRRGLDCVIVRPSLLDGDGGFGARWLRRVACWPVNLVPGGAGGRVAPLAVRDLGEALAELCERSPGTVARQVELGGTDWCTMREYLAALRVVHAANPLPAVVLTVPHWLARLCSHVCDLLRFSPFSFGHLELMSRDNLPRPNALPALLGRAPSQVGRVPRIPLPDGDSWAGAPAKPRY